MSHKKLIIIAFIIFIITTTLCILISLAQTGTSDNISNNPSSYPLSYTKPDNIIKISSNNYTGSKYAVITRDDTIELKNEVGDKFIIGLDHRQWKNIKWSPDNNLIGILGKDDFNKYDLYIYNIANQIWFKATNFEKFDTGIESFEWNNNQTVLFIQGVNPDRWLNRFNYASQSEILKLSRIFQGNIISISKDRKYLLVQNNLQFTLIDNSGGIITSFDNIIDDKGDKLNISNVILSQDNDKLLLQTLSGEIYKLELGSNRAINITLKDKFNSICDINEDVFLGYNYNKEQKNLSILNLNIKEQQLTNSAEILLKNFDNINLDKTQCYDNNNLLLYIKLTNSKIPSWYRIKDKSLEEVFIFKDINEISVRNI